jgi:hypothetical protein
VQHRQVCAADARDIAHHAVLVVVQELLAQPPTGMWRRSLNVPATVPITTALASTTPIAPERASPPTSISGQFAEPLIATDVEVK